MRDPRKPKGTIAARAFLLGCLGSLFLLLAVGCGGDDSASGSETAGGTSQAVTGPRRPTTRPVAPLLKPHLPEETEVEHHHSHEGKGPNGGALYVIGDEFAHVEFVGDREDGPMLYFLDEEAANGVRLEQPEIRAEVVPKGGGAAIAVTYKAVANELTGETVGDTSQFNAAFYPQEAIGGEGRLIDVTMKGITFDSIPLEDIPTPEGAQESQEGTVQP